MSNIISIHFRKALVLLFFAVVSMPLFSQQTEKSEMAIVMGQMLKYLQTEQKQVLKNKPAKAVNFNKDLLYSAQLTAGKRYAANHKQMVNYFLETLEVYRSKQIKNERIKHYNLLVNSCIACHQSVCPGPIAVIEKSLIKE